MEKAGVDGVAARSEWLTLHIAANAAGWILRFDRMEAQQVLH